VQVGLILETRMTHITKEFINLITSSPAWLKANDWGQVRPGHPEGSVGCHVTEQLLPFVNAWYINDEDYWDIVALCYLHDIGKPATTYVDGRLCGEPHSVVSANIAASLGTPDRLIQVILANDRAYSHWRKLIDKHGVWSAARWTAERRQKFREEFGRENLDLRLLVLFHRADNAYRRPVDPDEAIDYARWFENRLIEEKLIATLPEAGRDQRWAWIPDRQTAGPR
jgi:hypothetical protein